MQRTRLGDGSSVISYSRSSSAHCLTFLPTYRPQSTTLWRGLHSCRSLSTREDSRRKFAPKTASYRCLVSAPHSRLIMYSRRCAAYTIGCRGNSIIMTGTTCALTAVIWGGIQFPWNSAHVLSLLIIGFSLICLFFVYEFFIPKAPSLPLDVLSNRTSIGGYVLEYTANARLISHCDS